MRLMYRESLGRFNISFPIYRAKALPLRRTLTLAAGPSNPPQRLLAHQKA